MVVHAVSKGRQHLIDLAWLRAAPLPLPPHSLPRPPPSHPFPPSSLEHGKSAPLAPTHDIMGSGDNAMMLVQTRRALVDSHSHMRANMHAECACGMEWAEPHATAVDGCGNRNGNAGSGGDGDGSREGRANEVKFFLEKPQFGKENPAAPNHDKSRGVSGGRGRGRGGKRECDGEGRDMHSRVSAQCSGVTRIDFEARQSHEANAAMEPCNIQAGCAGGVGAGGLELEEAGGLRRGNGGGGGKRGLGERVGTESTCGEVNSGPLCSSIKKRKVGQHGGVGKAAQGANCETSKTGNGGCESDDDFKVAKPRRRKTTVRASLSIKGGCK